VPRRGGAPPDPGPGPGPGGGRGLAPCAPITSGRGGPGGGPDDKQGGPGGSLKEQEQATLSEAYYREGERLFGEMRYQEAAMQLRLAVRANPQNVEAQRLLDQVLYLLGDREAGYRDQTRELIRERDVKIQGASMEIERLYAEGLRYMDRAEYPKAIERFERALETIRWFPWPVDKSGLKAQIEAKMAEAKQKEAERELLFKEQMQKTAKEEAAVFEKRNQAYHQAQIRTLYEQAEAAFERTEYEKCERLCKKVLDMEPGHGPAAKLLETAAHARRFKLEVSRIDDDAEEMKRLIEGIYDAAIPYQEIFSFPSDKEWAAVEKRAVDLQAMFERKGRAESPEEARIRQTLANRKVTINFPGTSFEDALNFLREITGLNYYVAPAAQEALSSDDVKINLRLRDITLKNALELILSQAKDLIYKIKNDAVVINTKDAEKEDLYLRFYEVSDIVNDLPNNPAPKLALEDTSRSGKGQGGGTGGGAILNIDEGAEKQAGGGIGADKLKELIEQKLGDEGEGSVDFLQGLLMVRKPLSAHKKIEKLLDALRGTTGIMVTVESRIIDIQDNFLEEIGIDFRGLPAVIAGAISPTSGNTPIGFNWTNSDQDKDVRGVVQNVFQSLGSSAATPFRLTPIGGGAFQYNVLEDFQLQAILEAVKKTQKARQVDAPRVTVFNGQRSHVLSVRQKAYIADLEVNQTGVTPTINPVIGILNSGSILEARPIVSYDRKFVTLEIQPTLAKDLTAPGDNTRLRLANNNTDINIELPVVSMSEIRSTVMVPDGGTVIIGGLKNFLEEQKWSGVPILKDVPILHNLFERKGYTDMKRSLIVLLKVDITIAREKDAQLHNKQGPPSLR
jgi:general secretion pathway protein D